MDVKNLVEDVIFGRRRSIIIETALLLLSLLYRTIISLRGLLYRGHILSSRTLPCKVVSVGNITLGGTGKTPMVIFLAGMLREKGRHPVVVSRGYGRRDESETIVVTDGRSIQTDAHTGGDEPVLIGSKLSDVPVVVGGNRYAAARSALELFHPDTVILDDGFQHLRLRRDLDIVLIDATDPFGNGRLFPAGILREPASALRRAQTVVITRSDQAASLDALKTAISRITTARIFTSTQQPVDLVGYHTVDPKPLTVLRGTRVVAFCGIARPAGFLAMLRSLGAIIVSEHYYPDHHQYAKSDLVQFYKMAADHRSHMIITTEKDAVRLRQLSPEGIWALRIKLAVVEQEEWESFLLNNL